MFFLTLYVLLCVLHLSLVLAWVWEIFHIQLHNCIANANDADVWALQKTNVATLNCIVTQM